MAASATWPLPDMANLSIDFLNVDLGDPPDIVREDSNALLCWNHVNELYAEVNSYDRYLQQARAEEKTPEQLKKNPPKKSPDQLKSKKKARRRIAGSLLVALDCLALWAVKLVLSNEVSATKREYLSVAEAARERSEAVSVPDLFVLSFWL
jgi:hypothetical protein